MITETDLWPRPCSFPPPSTKFIVIQKIDKGKKVGQLFRLRESFYVHLFAAFFWHLSFSDDCLILSGESSASSTHEDSACYPVTASMEEAKAIWNKDYDRYSKKKDEYDEQKAKTFVVLIGLCTKAMKSEIEKQSNRFGFGLRFGEHQSISCFGMDWTIVDINRMTLRWTSKAITNRMKSFCWARLSATPPIMGQGFNTVWPP